MSVGQTPVPTPSTGPIHVTVHGPYEDAIIVGFTVLGKIIDKQDPTTAARLWDQWLTATKPMADLGAAMSTALSEALSKLGVLSK